MALFRLYFLAGKGVFDLGGEWAWKLGLVISEVFNIIYNTLSTHQCLPFSMADRA
jgi:hypothetical protein